MTSRRSHHSNNTVGPEKLSASVRAGRYCFETFMQDPFVHVKGSGTEPAGTSLTEQMLNTGRHIFEYAFAGDNTDVFIPTLATDGGYNFGGSSDVAGTGFELLFGGLREGHPRNFAPSSEDWFCRILLIVDDASGADLTFGVRKVGAYVATLSEYGDFFGIRILGDSSSTTGAFTIVTNLNNAASTDSYTSTSPSVAPTSLEDATAVELEVRGRGRNAYAYVNGVQLLGVTYTFDSGDKVSGFVRMLQATDVAAQIKVLAYEQGIIDADGNSDRQDGTLLSLAGATA